MGRLFLLFTVLPAVELLLLLQLGSALGPAATFGLIVLTGLVGAAVARHEGLSVLRQLAADTQRGAAPGPALTEAALVVAGGLLLVTPGIVTDVAGLAFVLPLTRRRIAPRIRAWATEHVVVATMPPPGAPPAPPGSSSSSTSPFDHPVA